MWHHNSTTSHKKSPFARLDAYRVMFFGVKLSWRSTHVNSISALHTPLLPVGVASVPLGPVACLECKYQFGVSIASLPSTWNTSLLYSSPSLLCSSSCNGENQLTVCLILLAPNLILWSATFSNFQKARHHLMRLINSETNCVVT